MKNLSEIKCFLLDMDGTVYLGGKLINGAKEAVARMRAAGRVLFVTNNTSVSRDDYVSKLRFMGIGAEREDIYTAGDATIAWLKRERIGKVFLLGTDRLRDEFVQSGIELTETDPEMVVVGFDTGLTYVNLSKTCKFIREGVRFIATHPDFNCPVRDGYIPDVGSFLALVEASTGRRPELICGKPYEEMGRGVRERTGIPPERTAMVGDRLMTDMRFAAANGFASVLVLSGETTAEAAAQSGMALDCVYNSIADILR